MVQEQENVTSFSILFDNVVHSVRFYLSNVWSTLLSHADRSYQNSIIFSSKKKGTMASESFQTPSLFIHFIRWNFKWIKLDKPFFPDNLHLIVVA